VVFHRIMARYRTTLQKTMPEGRELPVGSL
jgi:hypothetical protein